MSRTTNFVSNAGRKTISQIVVFILNMLNRYGFMHLMGAEYLGIISLFNSVFGILSFADLGLSSAFAACFYRAIANEDKERCIRLLNILERMIRKCVLVMFSVGMLLLPLLPSLITQTEAIGNQQMCIYYVLFLIDVLNGYLYMAKVCYVSAHQKEYIITPIITVFSAAKIIIGLLVIYTLHSYAAYLLSGIAVTTFQREYLNKYIGKEYPETKIKRQESNLDSDDKNIVIQNIKAVLNYKIADVCVAQTDSILLSAKTGIMMTGIVSNYVAIKVNVSNLINLISNSLMPSLGNALMTESSERQREIFYTFLSMNVFFSCGAITGLSLLSTPFIALFYGKEACIAQEIVLVMNVSTLLMIVNNALNILTISAGKYYIGIWIIWLAAILNLAVSWIGVNTLGVLGVYIGTLVSELFVYLIKPFVVMKKMYGVFPWDFFRITVHGMAASFLVYWLLRTVQKMYFVNILKWTDFIIWALVCGVTFIGGYSTLLLGNHFYKEGLCILRDLCKRILHKYCKN